MVERIATGIHWLDEQIEQGVPKHRVTIVIGQNGTGKSVFGLQYMRQGLHSDEHVAIITTKDSPQQIIERTQALGWDLQWAIDQERLWIIDCRYFFTEQSDSGDQLMLVQNLIREINRIIETKKIKRLLIDPLLPIQLMNNPSYAQLYTGHLINFLNQSALGVSTLIIHKPHALTEQIELDLSTGVIELSLKQDHGNIKRVMITRKIENTRCPDYELPFDIVKGEGIVQR